MSRLPRHLEHLKTGFTAEAVSAATFRAFAEQAEAEEKPNLAARWRRLAADKDRLAILQLRAAGRVSDESHNLQSAIAEEQYENEVLYPRMISALDHLQKAPEVELLERVVAEQKDHLGSLDRLRRELKGSQGDVGVSSGEAG